MTAVQQIGGAVGVAALGTILFSALQGGNATAGQVGVFGRAAQVTMWSAAGLVLLAFLFTLLLPKFARPHADDPDQGTEPSAEHATVD